MKIHTSLYFEPETAYLFVLNERGCVKITELNLDLGTPAFEYSSVTLEQGGNILANETITFSNGSKPIQDGNGISVMEPYKNSQLEKICLITMVMVLIMQKMN